MPPWQELVTCHEDYLAFHEIAPSLVRERFLYVGTGYEVNDGQCQPWTLQLVHVRFQMSRIKKIRASKVPTMQLIHFRFELLVLSFSLFMKILCKQTVKVRKQKCLNYLSLLVVCACVCVFSTSFLLELISRFYFVC